MRNHLVAIFLSASLGAGSVCAAEAPQSTPLGATPCEGTYTQHLQGVCTNGSDALYWSWTDKLVKTDAQGRVLLSVPVAFHHGDLCYHDGRVFVAVNLGKFNEPPGQEDSWVYVYDGVTLAELARHPVPELVHGAGGIAHRAGTFLVVGGLPPGTPENYLYEYDEAFRFQKRHILATGYTYKGIQTATWWDGSWWFGTYGETRYLLRADAQFKLSGRWVFDASIGIVPLGEGRFLIGSDRKLEAGRHQGRVAVFRLDATAGLVPESPAATGKPPAP